MLDISRWRRAAAGGGTLFCWRWAGRRGSGQLRPAWKFTYVKFVNYPTLATREVFVKYVHCKHVSSGLRSVQRLRVSQSTNFGFGCGPSAVLKYSLVIYSGKYISLRKETNNTSWYLFNYTQKGPANYITYVIITTNFQVM